MINQTYWVRSHAGPIWFETGTLAPPISAQGHIMTSKLKRTCSVLVCLAILSFSGAMLFSSSGESIAEILIYLTGIYGAAIAVIEVLSRPTPETTTDDQTSDV